MTNKELVKILREGPYLDIRPLLDAAATRIEAQEYEIERLRKANSDMGWRLNPDRMGGQFTEEEKNNTGWI